jgi:glycosyltransferase involved in cell wall biosynthesis
VTRRRTPASGQRLFRQTSRPERIGSLTSIEDPPATSAVRVRDGAVEAQPRASRVRPALISVIIPVRNGEPHLSAQLASLCAQTYDGRWEVVAVDNGCTDRSIETIGGWRDRLPALVVVDARARRGLNHARNMGAAAARGDFLAFCDADDVTAPGWLEALARAAEHADLVGGAVEFRELNGDLQRAWQPTDPLDSLPSSYGFMPSAPGGNCGIWADVARAIGWDESFRFGSSDIDFVWRVQLAGYRVAFAPGALIRVRFRPTLWSIARQYFKYGVSEPQLFRRWRRHGMERDLRRARANWLWLARSLPLLLNAGGRGRWLRVAAMCCGRICGSLRWRVVYL